ncbi:corA [Symbiodinium natans]|uniref:CorA protein n=1 Tax=Symbiodinium natans TaxID=878477 RepID=A0A812LIJ1_9DINO|nr:corA [Symbiodinium natans]
MAGGEKARAWATANLRQVLVQEEQRLDEIEGQADFWCSCFSSSASVNGVSDSLLAQGQVEGLLDVDVRENILEAFFDCTPERVRDVFASIDSDSNGHMLTVQHLRIGLERCGVAGLDNGTLAKVFERVSGTGRTLHLQAFETILCRLRLASLLARPWRANLSVVDYTDTASKASDQYIDASNMRSFFFGHRPGARGGQETWPVRWVHMPQFDLHLLLALTVKYSLHPLSVEDVIEQCPTKIDRLGGNYFLAIELLTLVDTGQGSKGRQPVRVRGQHVAAFCSGPPRLDTLITVTQTDRTFSQDWPGGPGVDTQTCPTTFGEGWPEKLRQRLKATRSRLRERRADSLLYTVVDLCADELVTVTRAFLARLSWLEEDLRTRGDESLLDLGEVSLAQLQLGIVTRRLRSLQRVVRRASEYHDLHTTGSADYWKDCADHLEEAYDDAMQMKERCDALKAAHERAVERGQALEMQCRNDEAAGQAEKLNSMLFFLTAATTLFTPVQFMSSVYGMNFVDVEGIPTIPELLRPHGYHHFWIGVTAYFAVAFVCAFWLYQRLQHKSRKQIWKKVSLPTCCCCCPR